MTEYVVMKHKMEAIDRHNFFKVREARGSSALAELLEMELAINPDLEKSIESFKKEFVEEQTQQES